MSESDFDEDALAGALFSGLDDRLKATVGHASETLGASRVGIAVEELLFAEVLLGLFHIEEAVVHPEEHRWCDFFAEAVARAEVLINPNFHRCSFESH